MRNGELPLVCGSSRAADTDTKTGRVQCVVFSADADGGRSISRFSALTSPDLSERNLGMGYDVAVCREGIMRTACIAVVLALFSVCAPSVGAQQGDRVKVAEGEYRVSEEGDLGVGPVETEIFHFRESWTLWRVQNGEYEVEGERTFYSPQDYIRFNRFVARLTRRLELVEVTEFRRLRFRRDSGPLTCELLLRQLRCSSAAKDPANAVDFDGAADRPYGFIWPLSAFSLGSLTRAASPHVGEPVRIQVVQLQELNDVLPVLPIRSDGFLKYLGQSDTPYMVSNQSWRPCVYELDTGPTRKMLIWTSPEGIVLSVERSNWPKGKMELVRFVKFSDF